MKINHLTLTAIALALMAVPAFAEKAEAKKVAPAAEATQEAAPAAAEDKAPEEAAAATETAPATEAAAEHAPAAANHEAAHESAGGHNMPHLDWSFDGPFGTYDKASLQRGFLVYKQVCASCHGLNKIYYRNLEALGYSEAQVKTIAAEYTVTDGPNDEGDMFDRPARPSDRVKSPFANSKAAAFANGGAVPPDLSLITKARHGGADYVYGVLTGYAEPPSGVTLTATQHYNKVKDGGLIGPDGAKIPGGILAMAPPLSDGLVSYEDNTAQTADQYARDVSHFLTWAAEPEMEHRKQMGIKVLIFLSFFALIMYATKRKVWEKLH